jgi:hypothetical protein
MCNPAFFGITKLTGTPFMKLNRKYRLAVLVLLFIIVGLFVIVIKPSNVFIRNQQPKELTGLKGLHERLLGHWESDHAHHYFSKDKIVEVSFERTQYFEYKIIDSNQDEEWIKFNVSWVDSIHPLMKTMYFLENGVAREITEIYGDSFHHIRIFKYVDSKQSP